MFDFRMHHTQIVFDTQKNLSMIFSDFSSSNFDFQINVLLKLDKSKSAKNSCPFVWQKALSYESKLSSFAITKIMQNFVSKLEGKAGETYCAEEAKFLYWE